MSFKPKAIFEKYFHPHPTKVGFYICLCGVQRKIEKNKGFTNAASHVMKEHPDYMSVMSSSVDDQQTTLNFLSTGISELAKQHYLWLEFIIMTNQSFVCVENRFVKSFAKVKSISRKTLMTLISGVSKLVKMKISHLVPSKFGVIFDGKYFLILLF